MFVQDIRLAKNAQRLNGQVVELAEIHSPNGGKLTAPIVAFRLPSGQEFSVRVGSWSSFSRYRLGQNIPLLVGFKEDKLCVDINTLARFAGYPTAILGGILMLAIGVFSLAHWVGYVFVF